jgi:hypothetical protein
MLVHLLTANAAPQLQLLALLAAAILIACSQVAFTIWRQRRGIPPGSPSTDQLTSFLRFRRNQRNPFFRELTSDWIGLDEHFADDQSVGATGVSVAAESERLSGKHSHGQSKES